MEQTKDMIQDEELQDNLKLCYSLVSGRKMKLGDRIGFEHKNRHYTFIRDE